MVADWIVRGMQRKQGVVVPPPAPRLPVPPPPPPPPAPVSAWLTQPRPGGKVQGTVAEEVDRILSMPVCEEARCPDPVGYGAGFLSPHTPDPDFRLWPTQIDALWTFETYGGLLGAISVGRGKAFTAILAASRAIRSRKHYRVVIIVPPDVFSQFTLRDLPRARQLFNLQGLPYRVCTGSWEQRRRIAKEPGSAVYVYAYSSISTKTGFDELKAIRATCYIMDEAQKLANPKSARTKRWQTALKELEADGVVQWGNAMMGSDKVTAMECVALSGTLTKKSVRDYAHLAARCLGTMSPAPIREMAVRIFSQALDSEANGSILSDQDARVLRRFIDWVKTQPVDITVLTKREGESDMEFATRQRVGLTLQEMIRLSYMYRLRTSPGVISTEGQGVDSSLLIRWIEPDRPDDEQTREMVSLMQKVVVKQETPSGDVIDYGMHQFKWLWEISSGFYNNLIWPALEKIRVDYQRRFNKDISEVQAEALLNQAKKHHSLLQVYHKELRKFLDTKHIPKVDTPLTVAQEIIKVLDGSDNQYRLPPALVEAYRIQREQGPHRYPDLPERVSTPVFVSDYKVKAAAAWATDRKDGIIWYHHPFIGEAIHQRLEEAGIQHTFARAGENEKVFTPGLVIASFAHGTGKNLQHQWQNLFVELRREAAVMEQALGRTHRSGQLADTVEAAVLIGNGFDLAMFNGILKDADYAQSTLGQQQRLCYADYDPIIPPINPRLMLKLGIIKHQVSGAQFQAWEAITPPTMKEVADLFRPVAYGVAKIGA